MHKYLISAIQYQYAWKMRRLKLNNLLNQSLLFIKTSNNNSGQFNRVLCVAVLIGYLISWSSIAYDGLVSKPGTVLPPRFHIWTMFSAPLVENHLLVVLFNVLFILTLGKVVAPLWGDVESIIYFAVINFSTIVVCSLFYLILYILRGDLHYLYFVRLHGLTSYIVALSVAIKQVMPEQVVVQLPNSTKIRYGRNFSLHIQIFLDLHAFLKSFFLLQKSKYTVNDVAAFCYTVARETNAERIYADVVFWIYFWLYVFAAFSEAHWRACSELERTACRRTRRFVGGIQFCHVRVCVECAVHEIHKMTASCG